MPRPPDLNWYQHLQCPNSQGTVDLLFLAQGPVPQSCSAFVQARIGPSDLLTLYKQAASAIRDLTTRARRQLAALLEREAVSEAMAASMVLADIDASDDVLAQWQRDLRAAHDDLDCASLAPLKGPPAVPAGFPDAISAPAP